MVFKAAALSPGTSGHPVALAGIPVGDGHPQVLDQIQKMQGCCEKEESSPMEAKRPTMSFSP